MGRGDGCSIAGFRSVSGFGPWFWCPGFWIPGFMFRPYVFFDLGTQDPCPAFQVPCFGSRVWDFRARVFDRGHTRCRAVEGSTVLPGPGLGSPGSWVSWVLVLRFRVPGAGSWVPGSGFQVPGQGIVFPEDPIPGCSSSGLKFVVWFWVTGPGCQVSGPGY